MKKIIFACCAMCFLTGVAFGGDKKCGVECNDTNKYKYFLCSESGKSDVSVYVCADGLWREPDDDDDYFVTDCNEGYVIPDSSYKSYGYWNENFRLYVKKTLPRNGTGYLVDNADFGDNFCLACQQGYKFDANANKCVNDKKPVIKTECKLGDPNCNQNPRSAQLAHPCPEGKKQYDECLTGNSKAPSNATKARCVYLQGKTNEAQQLTCAATECKDGYLLWLNKNGNSMGICHTEQRAKEMCSTGCGNCNPNEECVPWIVDTPNNLKINGQNLVPKKNGAYRECHCVEKTNGNGGNGGGGDSSPDTEECKECVYTLKVDLRCANGKTFNKNTQIKITKAEAEKLRWEEAKQQLDTATSGDVIDNLLREIKGYEELINKICDTGNNGGGMVVVIDNSEEINAAKNKISSFFNTAESNASVWKDAEGKFNTARLASDLTAGVVLGTVGGVVSGVVIKKKQVEKGFEALHCTVGGQPIADWGDTFNVGLR